MDRDNSGYCRRRDILSKGEFCGRTFVADDYRSGIDNQWLIFIICYQPKFDSERKTGAGRGNITRQHANKNYRQFFRFFFWLVGRGDFIGLVFGKLK